MAKPMSIASRKRAPNKQNTPVPPPKKQRKIPGPCSSCQRMGHASNNNKKYPNYQTKNVTPPLPAFDVLSIPNSDDSSVRHEVIDFNKPLHEMFEGELMKLGGKSVELLESK